MAESKKMMKKEVAFMEKKGAPKSMIKHEKAEMKAEKPKKFLAGGIAGGATFTPSGKQSLAQMRQSIGPIMQERRAIQSQRQSLGDEAVKQKMADFRQKYGSQLAAHAQRRDAGLATLGPSGKEDWRKMIGIESQMRQGREAIQAARAAGDRKTVRGLMQNQQQLRQQYQPYKQNILDRVIYKEGGETEAKPTKSVRGGGVERQGKTRGKFI